LTIALLSSPIFSQTLRRQAERLNDTLVAIDRRLTAAERGKFRTQGIIVQDDAVTR